MYFFLVLEINFEFYIIFFVVCVWFNNYLLFNIIVKKNLLYMYCIFRFI